MRRVALIAAMVGLAGCAWIKPHAGFDEVRSAAAARGAPEVRWRSGTKEDGEAEAVVRGLLAQELTPEGAARVALLNNRELQATFERLGVAQADLVRAGLLKNPVLSADAKFALSGGTDVDLGLVANFLEVLWVPVRKRVAAAEFRRVQAEVTGAVIDLAFAARAEMCRYQAALELGEVRAKQAEALAASAELAGRLRDAGNITELELVTRRAAAEEAAADAAMLESRAVEEREKLNVLMGVWGEQAGWRAAGLGALPAPEPGHADVEARAVGASLRLAGLREEVDAAAERAGTSEPVWGADVAAGAASEWVDGGWSVGPAVEVPVPIFDTGVAAGAGARSELNMARDRFYAAAVEVRARARAAAAGVAAARARAERYEKVIVPLRERVVAETLKQYNGMQVGAFALLDAKREELEARARGVEARRDFWVAEGRLGAVLAGGDGEGAMRGESGTGGG